MSKFSKGDKVKRKLSMWEGITYPPTSLAGFDEFTVSYFNSSVPYSTVCFEESGGYHWDSAYFELVEASQKTEVNNNTKVKSDGGSSSYYELTITNKAGETIKVETGDVIRAMVGNDFDFGNIIKAVRRMYLATQGMGKEGTDLGYDANKVRYFLDEIERVNK